jgi:putative nucleotidyltransferase with HDIG domain
MVKPIKSLLRWRRVRVWFARRVRIRLDRPKVALMLFTVAALSILMSLHLRPDRIALHVGDVSTRELRAGRSVSYIDSVKTRALQQMAMDAVHPVYDIEEGAAESAGRVVAQSFDRMARERSALARPLPKKRGAALRALQTAMATSDFASMLPQPALRHLLTLPPATFDKLRDTTTVLVNEAMDREIRNNGRDLTLALQDVSDAITEVVPEEAGRAVALLVAEEALRPNRRYDPRRTEMAKAAAARTVGAVPARLLLGDKILGIGDVVTPEALDKLTALGLVDTRQELTTNIAIGLLSAVMVLLVVYYIARMLPGLYRDNRRLALLSTIVLLSVLGIKIGAAMFGLSVSGGQLGYLGMMSVTGAGMLVSVLLDMNLAVLIVALLSVQSGILMNHEIRFTVMTLMSSLVGIGSVRNACGRTNLLSATAALALVNVGMVWLLGLLFDDTPRELLRASAWAAVTAGLATFLFWFGMLMLERPFGILTHTSLLELSAFDRPLLQQLCARAPGTYAHSMMVGTLAEAAAQAIDANALLCKVAGYYHDIGKMNQPDFFVENQRHENVHGRLSPSLSALIIIGHVREGVAMAREAHLPTEIRDIIAQHHGTTLISYFYHQALADNGGSAQLPPGMEERFRYPGPKPQTREAAIVMLADSVEAAARCIEKPNGEQLTKLVGGIVRGKIEDGQLDECSLTFQDVKRISDSFLHVLKAMMHGRINYPTPKETARVVSAQDLEPTPPPVSAAPIARAAALVEGLTELDPEQATTLSERIEPETVREITAQLSSVERLS